MEPIIPQPENTQREGVAPSDMAPSISEAALLYQQTMAATPPTATTLAAQPMEPVKDVVMTDSIMDGASSPAILPSATVTNGSTSVPARIGTPSRSNGGDATSRATSVHPDPTPAIPREAAQHGAPWRRYCNDKVTGPLMDGMKKLAKEQPRDPLRVLGEYLLQKSKEIEGTQ